MSQRLLFITMLAVLAVGAAPVCFANEHAAHEAVAEEHDHEEVHAAAPATAPAAENKKPGFVTVMIKGFSEYYGEFIGKIDEMRELDENYESAKERAVALEIENRELREKNTGESEGHRAEGLKRIAKAEGGSVVSRTIASLEADPALLSKPPRLVFQGASKAFEAGDYETAAKAFFALVSNAENSTYQNSQTYYLTAVSLYHVGNYRTAEELFHKLAYERVDDATVSFTPRAMAWLALCRSKVGDREGARAIASKLVQTHPKSREAQKVNRDEKFR